MAKLSNLFNLRRRAISHQFDVAIHYLLHDAENLIPLLKERYRDEWSGFVDDILNGAHPYEEATAVVRILLQQSFENLDQAQRDAVIECIAGNNFANPPNFLRIIGQVCYFLYLAERDGEVRDKRWSVWLNDMSKMLIESRQLSAEQCITYLTTLSNLDRDEKHKAALQQQKEVIRKASKHMGSDPDCVMEAPTEANRIARLERSALECADMAAKARDPRAKAVLTTAANVWRSLAKQRSYQGQSKQAGEMVDHLDTMIMDRESRAINEE